PGGIGRAEIAVVACRARPALVGAVYGQAPTGRCQLRTARASEERAEVAGATVPVRSAFLDARRGIAFILRVDEQWNAAHGAVGRRPGRGRTDRARAGPPRE